jgi:PAS domain-containing protein
MMKSSHSESANLRQKAEELLKKRKGDLANFTPTEADMLKLIHELEVHQIELELQNEELELATMRAEIATKKYLELYDFAPTGYFTLNVDGEIIDLNFYGSQMLSKERSALKNSRFGFFISDDSKPHFNHFLDEVFISKTKQTCEVTLISQGNSPLFVNLTGVVSEKENQCFINADDISEIKQIEDVLRESERFLQETQKIANLGTYKLDISSGRWESSEILDAIFGVGPDYDKSVDGWVAIIHPDWQQTMNDYLNLEVLCKKTRFDIEYKIIQQNSKTERWVHGIGTLKYNENNQPIELVGTVLDITERKQAAQIIENLNDQLILTNADKDRFISILAHDLKSPFTALLGFSDLQKENLKSYDLDEIATMVNLSNLAAHSTYDLLEDILIWA